MMVNSVKSIPVNWSNNIMVRSYTSNTKRNRLLLDDLLLIKSRFLAGCILLLIGFILILIVLVSCLLARKKSKSKGKEMRITRRRPNGNIEQSSSSPIAHPIIIDSSEQESGSIQLETYRTSTGKYSSSQKRLFSVWTVQSFRCIFSWENKRIETRRANLDLFSMIE